MKLSLSDAAKRPRALFMLAAGYALAARNLDEIIDIQIFIGQATLDEIIDSGIRIAVRSNEINGFPILGNRAGRKCAKRMKTGHILD